MTDAFRNYATSTAFSISLSKRQVEYLLHVAAGSIGYIESGHSLTTGSALERRGLIEKQKLKQKFTDVCGQEKISTWIRPKLTEAGEALVPLLRIAGFEVVPVVSPLEAFLTDIEERKGAAQ